ncbi:MAG: hypothetical protein ACOYZ7_04915 [Chloroflexota bacterium]
MAKARKTRRAKVRRSQTARPARPMAVAKEATVVEPEPQSLSFAHEYQYVVGDLKRIFVLAAGMLALIMVLALVFR